MAYEVGPSWFHFLDEKSKARQFQYLDVDLAPGFDPYNKELK